MNTTTQANPNPDWSYSGVCLTIHNIILDPDKLSPTPSASDKLDADSELDLRILGCELIQDAGILLKLPQVAMATAQVLFQRFFYSRSFVKHHYEHYSMGCIYLAAKIEENPRRLRDVINVFHHLRTMKLQKPIVAMLLDQDYFNVKNQVIKAERRVLKELGFCVHGKHPHKLIICYLQALGMEKNHNLVQISWNYMNDSLRTDVFVRYYPETIACACIFLAARQLAVPLPNNPPWWEMFNVTESAIHTISLQLLHLYARDKPNIVALDAKLLKLRKAQSDMKNKLSATFNTNHANNDSGSGTNSAVKGGGSSPVQSNGAKSGKLSDSKTNNTSKSTNHSLKLDRQATYRHRSPSSSRDRDRRRKSKKSPITMSNGDGGDFNRHRKPRRSRSHGSSSRSSSRHRHKRKTHRNASKKKRLSKKRSRSPPNRTPKAYRRRARSSTHSKSRSRSPPLPDRQFAKRSNSNRGQASLSQENRSGGKHQQTRNNHKTSSTTTIPAGQKRSKHKRAVSVSSASSYSPSPPPVPRKKVQDTKRNRDVKSSSISSPEEQISKRHALKTMRRSRSRDRRR